MAIRLYSEFLSDQGTQYKIELHDSEWLGGAHEFECDADGFTLNYTGETDDIISPIISSECEIGVAIRTGQVLNYFDALKTYQENRFRVVIYTTDAYKVSQDYRQRVLDDGGTFEGFECVQDAVQALGGVDYRIYWAGWIMQDLVTLEDASEPYFMRLKAVDGIGRLANIEYTDTNDITQNGLGITRSNIVVYNCLEAIGTSDLWGSSVAFLETCVDWWEVTKMTYATTDDPLYLSGIDVGLFASKDDDGNTIRLSYFDVLKQLAVLWNARVYITDGRFIFEQVGARASTSRYISQYDKTGTVIANPSVSDDITIDQTSGNARLAGNSWDFLPALKKVSVTYAQRFLSPWFGVGAFNDSHSEETAGFVAGGSGIQFALYGPVNYSITSSTGATTNDAFAITPIFRVQIRIEDSSNPGTYYYYNRGFNGYAFGVTTFDTPAWSTTAGYYYFDVEAQGVGGGIGSFYDLTTITTSDIPVTGTLRVLVEKYSVYNIQNNTVYTLEGHQSDTWSIVFTFSRVDNGQEPASGEVYTATNSSSAIGSNLTLDLGEVNIGDGALQTGDLVVFNSSTSAWDASSAWRKGNSGTGVPILKLMTREALALHAKPIQRYNGKLMSSPTFQPRRLFDGTYWLFTEGKFNANFDEWDASMFSIARSTTNITEATPVAQDRTPALGRSGGSTPTGGPNELNAGKVGGMGIDAENQRLGPFQEFTGGGRVVGEFNTTGNATLDQKLLVDGGTVLGLGSAATAFSTRVTTDGGTIESLSCVTTAITELSGNTVSVLQDTSIKETLSVEGQTTLKATAADFIDLSLTADADANVAGRLTWNDAEQTVRVGLSQDVTLNIGEDDKMFVRNTSGVTINKGTLVMSTGISGNKVTIAKAVTDGSVSPKYMVGVLAQTLLNNESGVAFWRGFINGIDTSAFSEGAVLWNDPSIAGALTDNEPTAPNLKMSVAIVTKSNASTGEIYCRPWLGNKLSEIHDVAESATVASGDLIRRSSSGTYETFTPDYYSPAEGSAPTLGSEGSSPTIPYGTDNGNYLAEPDKWGRITIGGTNYVFPLFIEP